MTNRITLGNISTSKSIESDYISFNHSLWIKNGYKSIIIVFNKEYGLKGCITVYDFAKDNTGHNIVQYYREMGYNECLAWVKYLSKITG